MKALQRRYAGKPVRFLLFPCNQFDNQEPDSNEKIRKFAEQYIDLNEGNMIMFAKSNLNHVRCLDDGIDACTPGSSMCCPSNDGIYDYLFTYPLRCSKCTEATTKLAPIGWNFNKIFVNEDGYPWMDEILPSDDFDLNPYIDAMLAHASPSMFVSSAIAPNTNWISNPLVALGVFALAGVVLLSFTIGSRSRARTFSKHDISDCYLRVA